MVVLASMESIVPADASRIGDDVPELNSAVEYWVSSLQRHDKSLPVWKVQTFRDALFAGIRRRFEGHWYPEQPERGQGYRALLCAERVDNLLLEALWKAGLTDVDFRKIANEQHMVMYIDPGHVALRVSPSYMSSRRSEITHTLFPLPYAREQYAMA